ncbi:MAG: LysR family transcriptional regulator [Methylacidiphilales bacterium]|nr:LysR family transcriptional regulator [Candidatus Methylacidiphilales bacterium]
MNLDDMQAFVAAVEAGSVGRAALRLNLTQPAVSRRIQRLEEALDAILLDRDSKPAKPTPAGESAYRRCVAVLRATAELERETRGVIAAGRGYRARAIVRGWRGPCRPAAHAGRINVADPALARTASGAGHTGTIDRFRALFPE